MAKGLRIGTRNAPPAHAGGVPQPLAHGHVPRHSLPVSISRARSTHQPVALGDHVVPVDRLEVLLARRHEGVARRGRPKRSVAMRTISRTQSSTKRGSHVGLLDDLDLVAALHQLVDLRAHRRLDDLEQRLRLDAPRCSPRGSRCGACRCRAGCAWPPARPRRRARSRSSSKPASRSRSLRALHDHLLRARAGGHALSLDADQPARADAATPPRSRTACRSPASACPTPGVGLCSG